MARKINQTRDFTANQTHIQKNRRYTTLVHDFFYVSLLPLSIYLSSLGDSDTFDISLIHYIIASTRHKGQSPKAPSRRERTKKSRKHIAVTIFSVLCFLYDMSNVLTESSN